MARLERRPNPRLQRTRAALSLQTIRGESSSLGGVRRAPLSRKPLGVGRARCAPACRAEAEQGSAGSPQAASRGVARITAPAPWPGHAGRRLST